MMYRSLVGLTLTNCRTLGEIIEFIIERVARSLVHSFLEYNGRNGSIVMHLFYRLID